MTVREYLGARYVPLFMGEWDNTVIYEPLSVVTYMGDSYTSRQAVPAGIPCNNETYWAQSGNYNAQIEAYRQEVFTFDERIDDLEGKFPVDSADIADNAITSAKIADGAIATADIADGAVTSAKIEDGAVTGAKLASGAVTQTTIEDDRCFVSFGDSWSTTDNPNINHYADWLDWWIEDSNYNSSNVFRFGNGGAGWIRAGEHGSMLTQITTAMSTMTAEQRMKTDKVLAIAGVNDVSNGETYQSMQTAIGTFIANCRTAFPNARIYLCPLNVPGPSYSAIRDLCHIYHKELFLFLSTEKLSNTYLFDMINWFCPYLGWASSIFTDGNHLHLKAMGNRIFYEKISQILKDGKPETDIQLAISPKNGCQFNSSDTDYNQPFVRVQEGILTIQNLVWVHLGSSLAYGESVTIGQIQGGAFPQLTGYRPDSIAFAQSTGGNIGKFQFQDNGDIIFKSDYNGTIGTSTNIAMAPVNINCW